MAWAAFSLLAGLSIGFFLALLAMQSIDKEYPRNLFFVFCLWIFVTSYCAVIGAVAFWLVDWLT